MTDQQAVEQQLAAAAKAPRVRLGDVEQAIREGKVTYTVLPNGRTTVCQIDLFGGLFSVEGQSACVSKENFNPTFGENAAFAKAQDRVWEALGCALAARLYDESLKASSTFLERLKIEAFELETRLTKLDFFLGSAQCAALPAIDQKDPEPRHG